MSLSTRPASVSFDRVAATYDETRGGSARAEHFAAALAPLVAGERLLELGVGTGSVAASLARVSGRAVVGLDLSPAMLAAAVGRLGQRVAVADAHRLPLASGTVDTVLCIWVLQLLGEPSMAAAELARVLRAGGRLVVVTSDVVVVDDDDVTAALTANVPSLPARPLPAGRTARVAVDTVDRAVPLLECAGFQVLERGSLPPMREERSPASTAAAVSARALGSLAALDNRTFERLSAPMLRALAALPDQQRMRTRLVTHEWLAAGRP